MTDKQTQLAWLDKQRSIVNDMIVNLPPDEQRKLLPELQVISAIAERVREMSAVEYLEAREKMPMMEATKAIFAVGKDNRRAVEIVRKWKEEQRMSYDIELQHPITHETLVCEVAHQIRGGTYAVGGTQEMWLNITYNYGRFYRRDDVFGERGIRMIYGMTGAESIPVLKKAMAALKDDVSNDYWEPTEGNAKQALAGLLAFAQMRPDGVWDGD